ncbi:hypothetical protein [Curtobacterium sp. TC1]|nr:hypothetical protein [Curtobacterium sp. TC1]
MIQAYQPSVVICLLGANDAVGGYTAKQVVTNPQRPRRSRCERQR